MTNSLAAAQATGPHWRAALRSCLDDLGPMAEKANLGFVYVNEGFAADLGEIAAELDGALPHCVTAAGLGVFGPMGELTDQRAISVLTARFEPEGFRSLSVRNESELTAFVGRHQDWLRRQTSLAAIIHADPEVPHIGETIGALANRTSAFLIGGLMTSHSGATGLSGVILGDQVDLITALTQGCTPLGPPHLVTESQGEVLITLDGRPALEVMKEEAGELISRDLRRAAGIIHIALPHEHSDGKDYAVRNLIAIDPAEGWIAAAARLLKGERMMFVRRDANAAQRDMKRMVEDLRRRLEGRRISGGLYVSCVARGAHMFGEAGREIALIHQGLGQFPLIGFAANGEICGGRVYSYTGILTLFLER